MGPMDQPSPSFFNIQSEAIDKVEDITNTVFIELGFDNGHSNHKEREQSYWKWVKDTSGRTFGFQFIVKYTTVSLGDVVDKIHKNEIILIKRNNEPCLSG
jgi:hypothetical protein